MFEPYLCLQSRRKIRLAVNLQCGEGEISLWEEVQSSPSSFLPCKKQPRKCRELEYSDLTIGLLHAICPSAVVSSRSHRLLPFNTNVLVGVMCYQTPCDF